MPRDALHLHHARYWRREDSRDLPIPTRSSSARTAPWIPVDRRRGHDSNCRLEENHYDGTTRAIGKHRERSGRGARESRACDQPGFDMPPIEEDRGEPGKTVPVEPNIETAPEAGGRPETDAAVENPTLTDVFDLVQRLSTQKAQEEKDGGTRLNAGIRKLLEITRKLTAHAGETRSLIDGLSAAGTRQQEAQAVADRLEEAIVDYTADLRRAAGHERRRWTWPGLALAVAVPAFFLLGVLSSSSSRSSPSTIRPEGGAAISGITMATR